jgi:hypothetical protein
MTSVLRCALSFLLAALAFAAPAHAAPLTPDPTGVWFDPANPGWGVSITQQGGTMFVALFAYDANHKPVWYVASNVVDTGMNLDPTSQEIFSGMLFRTTGPWLGNATFDRNFVTATSVGFLSLIRGIVPGTLQMNYSTSGTTLSKTLQAQVWSSATSRLVNGYGGGVAINTATGSSCTDPGVWSSPAEGFSIAQDSATGHVFLEWGTGIDTGCQMDATFAQAGQAITVSGPFQCAPIGFTFQTSNTLTLSDVRLGPHGLSAAATLQTPTCTYTGNVGGSVSASTAPVAQSMQPDPTGVWFDPAAPGYGLALTQQGANIFAVIFAYGTDNTPQWLVASNVVDSGTAVFVPSHDFFGTNAEVFSGPLYRTSGPFTGATADTTPFNATSIGTLQVRYGVGDGPFGSVLVADIAFDGTSVERILQRQSWSAANFAGTYTGALSVIAPTANDCDKTSNAGTFQWHPPAMTVTQSQGNATIAWQPDSGTSCSVSGALASFGNLAYFSGNGQCISNATPATISQFTIPELAITDHGFSGALTYTATASLTNVTCAYSGTIGGVRR